MSVGDVLDMTQTTRTPSVNRICEEFGVSILARQRATL